MPRIAQLYLLRLDLNALGDQQGVGCESTAAGLDGIALARLMMLAFMSE
jgi:hypothetical protein